MHVVYRGANNDIHELYWQDDAYGVNDLTSGTNAPAAAGNPNVSVRRARADARRLSQRRRSYR